MQDIHGIRPPIQVGVDPRTLTIILMALGGILLLLLFAFLIRKWLKRQKESKGMTLLPETVAPYDAALRALDILLQKQDLDPRIFYFDLTAILRRYIGHSYGINAIEMTSQEFIKKVNQLDLARDIKNNIALFQKTSDPIKYAGRIPDKANLQQDIIFTKTVIQKIEKNFLQQETVQGEGG